MGGVTALVWGAFFDKKGSYGSRTQTKSPHDPGYQRKRLELGSACLSNYPTVRN